MSSKVRSWLIGLKYFFKWPHWWPVSTWIFPQIIPFVTNFNMDYSFLNLFHSIEISKKQFQEGCPMRSVASSLADIYLFVTSYRQTSQKTMFQERCPMRSIDDSLVEKISSNEPIGCQLHHWSFIPNLI